MKRNKFGIIGTDDLKEEKGYIAHILGVNAEEGDEITEVFGIMNGFIKDKNP